MTKGKHATPMFHNGELVIGVAEGNSVKPMRPSPDDSVPTTKSLFFDTRPTSEREPEAVRWRGDEDAAYQTWFVKAILEGKIVPGTDTSIYLTGSDSVLTEVKLGDWVLMRPDGTLYTTTTEELKKELEAKLLISPGELDPRVDLVIKVNPDIKHLWSEFKQNPAILDYVGGTDESLIFQRLLEECSTEWLAQGNGH